MNVDYPIDVVIQPAGSDGVVHHRFQKDDLYEVSKTWQALIRQSVGALPSAWMEPILSKLPEEPSRAIPLHAV